MYSAGSKCDCTCGTKTEEFHTIPWLTAVVERTNLRFRRKFLPAWRPQTHS